MPQDTPEPSKSTLDACRRCELWQDATQGVPGEGGRYARLLLVGEQPGNDEDLAGRPFVGPAGRLLHALLAEAGVPPQQVYITNAVKHFRYELRGKRRLHKTPLQRHVAACHAWLEAEWQRVRPVVIVTLGATALKAVLGPRYSVASARGVELRHEESGARVVATFHPSAVLRGPDEDARATLRSAILEDLVTASRFALAAGEGPV